MIKKTILSAILLAAFAFKTSGPDPSQHFHVTLSLPVNTWNAVINTISASDNLSAKDAAEINREIIAQIQAQLPKDSTAKKPVPVKK